MKREGFKYKKGNKIIVCWEGKHKDAVLIRWVNSDVYTIAKYLGVRPRLVTIVEKNNTSHTSYAYGADVRIGIKYGYNRQILVHEFLHVKGYKHGKKMKGYLKYQTAIARDSFSEYWEEKIFGSITVRKALCLNDSYVQN